MSRQQPQKQADAARTIRSKENVDMQAAIQECGKCHDVCVSTMTHCLDQGSRHAEANHIKALLDCIDFCTTCVGFMLRDSLAHRRVGGICAEVCDACAVSCEGFPDDKVVSECAKECRRCAESCRKMARAPHYAQALGV